MIFNDIFNVSVWLMMNSDEEFAGLFTDFLMDISGEGIERIKKDRSTSYNDESQLMLFKRKNDEIELKLDTDFKTYLFQCDSLSISSFDKLPCIKLNEPFDLEECGIHIGKLHILDKNENKVYSHFFSLVKSGEQYHVVYGKTTGTGENLEILGTSFKSFLKEEVEENFRNIKNLR